MSKRALLALLTGLCLLLPALGSFAADDASSIAIVDLKRCLFESKRGKEVKTEFEGKVSKVDAKASALEKEARDLMGEVERQGALLTDAVKREKQERFLAIRTELGNLEKQRNKMNEEMTLAVLTDIQGVIKALAEERGLKLVLSDAGPWLLYNSKALEITDEVITRYDAKHGK